MKQQFVRIQPSRSDGAPQQEFSSEEQLPGKAQARQASTFPPEGSTPPAAQDATEKSPASYWAREEPEEARTSSNATRYSQAGAKQVPMNASWQAGQLPPGPTGSGAVPYTPPANRPPAQQLLVTPSQGIVPPPSAPRPPYGPPMHPGMPSGQRPYNAPAAMYPPYGPTQPSMPLYGPPTHPDMSSGQRPSGDPTLQNNALPMQVPPVGSGKAIRKKRRFPIWARVVVVLVAVLLVGGGTAFGYYQANFANPLEKITGQQAAQIGADGQSTSQMAATGNGIGNKRVNILLLGSDNDGKNAAPLAQTDIVVTIDPQTNYVGMLSIPRDLRVVIPDEGTGKMDAAFSYGWQGNFGGATQLSNAAGLSIATVEKNFGIHIDYYAWVGLEGFVKVINTANGVDVDATHPIVDNAYPNDVNSANPFAYQRLYILPGPQHMDGVQALEYVRSRHADLVGDFGRSARQQQILSQLKTRLDTPSIITKLPELANDLGDSVKTDMSVQDIINFMGFAHNIDITKVDRLILSPPYSSMASDTTGDYLPNCSLITPKIAQMFDLGNNANCISTASVNPSNTMLATHQLGTHTSTSAVSTTALSNSARLATQLLSQLHPIQPTEANITGVHSLLDLMFLVVFNSLDATKV